MAEWRSRGYVADSDEEEDSQGTNLSIHVVGDRQEQDPACDEREQERHLARLQAVVINNESHHRQPGGLASQPVGNLPGLLEADEEETKSSTNVDEENNYIAAPAVSISGDGQSAPATPVQNTASVALHFDSASSSPLSDAPSSLPDSVELLDSNSEARNRSLQKDQVAAVAQPSQTSDLIDEVYTSRHVEEDVDLDRVIRQAQSNRTFRSRKAVQLRPYLLDEARYDRLRRDYGLARVQFDTDSRRPTSKSHAESQDTEFTAPEASFASHVSELPDRAASLLSPVEDERGSAGEELPDVETLLNRPAFVTTSSRHKRRKVSEQRGPSSRGLAAKPNSDAAADAATVGQDILDIAPSPPRSSLRTTDRPFSDLRFRLPPLLAAGSIPTPLPSSSREQCTTLTSPLAEISDILAESDSSAQDGLSTAVVAVAHDEDDGAFGDDLAAVGASSPRSTTMISVSNGETASESEEMQPTEETSTIQIDSQLHRAERRIRGVLPASWLRLDLKAQTKKPIERPENTSGTSPNKAQNNRGVARPKQKQSRNLSRAPRALQRAPSIESLDSQSTEEGEGRGIISPSATRPIRNQLMDDLGARFEGEASEHEEDAFDLMLQKTRRVWSSRASKPRRRHASDKQQDKQSRLQFVSVKGRSDTTQKPHITSSLSKTSQSRLRRSPELSILDVIPEGERHGQGTPKFLRVAARTARGRSDQGRSKLSRKNFQLHSARDNEDILTTVKAWRTGQLKPKTPLHRRQPNVRQPLSARSHNIQSSREKVRGLNNSPGLGHHETECANFTTAADLPGEPGIEIVEKENIAQTPLMESRSASISKQTSVRQLSASVSNARVSRPAVLQDAALARLGLQSLGRSRGKVSMPLPRVQGRGFSNADANLVNNASLDPGISVPLQASTVSPQAIAKSKPKRKRLPRRRSFTDGQRHREEVLSPSLPSPASLDATDSPQTSRTIRGLDRFDAVYSHSFDITPLSSATSFSRCSILGSGMLQMLSKNHESHSEFGPGRQICIQLGDYTFQWSKWNEQVSAECQMCYDQVGTSLQQSLDSGVSLENHSRTSFVSIFQSMLLYVTEIVSFYDPIDQAEFLNHWANQCSYFTERCRLGQPLISPTPARATQSLTLKLMTLNLMVSSRLRCISESQHVKANSQRTVQRAFSNAYQAVTRELSQHLPIFEAIVNRLNHRLDQHDAVDDEDDDQVIETFVVVQHLSLLTKDPGHNVFQILGEDLRGLEASRCVKSETLERVWRHLFSILPFLEIDERGFLDKGRRLLSTSSNWPLVRRLVAIVLESHHPDVRQIPPGYNTYCRATFQRCLHLIKQWGWYQCDTIIGTLFDFFAKRNLHHLVCELSHGSPDYLNRLDRNPGLVIEPQDRCFHVFLKIIGTGLREMRERCSEKKIRGLVWRLMPNHGRFHPKDRSIRQEDLDALRNHHDLLSTLYWAAPPHCRPSVSAIQGLVDLGNSHREVCHIAIATWRNLVRFQASTTESNENLGDFRQWLQDILVKALQQHHQARPEAEDHVRQANRDAIIPTSLLDWNIANNQRQVQAVLSDALTALQSAVLSCRSRTAAFALLPEGVGSVFDLFDSSTSQPHGVIGDALQAIRMVLQHKMFDELTGDTEEDSQDYGDWSVFNDNSLLQVSDTIVSDGEHRSLDAISNSLRSLLSNSFGADRSPGDDFLCKVAEAWVEMGSAMVDLGLKSWNAFIGQYGKDSWHSLRTTPQTRKFIPFVFAALLGRDKNIYYEYRLEILSSWVTCLVARESQLKYQHLLTSAIFNNAASDDPLHFNPPFARQSSSGLFQVSAREFSERRMALMSNLISNIRTVSGSQLSERNGKLPQAQQENVTLLRGLMSSLKANFEESGGSETQGTYVEFVHQIIQIMQEHTSGICAIDRFFTDNRAFPLPQSDPLYVTGQLRRYTLRLQDAGTGKQLATFLQTLLEQAASVGQLAQMVDQLHAALADRDQAALRTFILRQALPAYTKSAIAHPCGWLLVVALLDAVREHFRDCELYLDGFDDDGVDQVLDHVSDFAGCMRGAFLMQRGCPNTGHVPSMLRVFGTFYDVLETLIPLVHHISRLRPNQRLAVRQYRHCTMLATLGPLEFRSGAAAQSKLTKGREAPSESGLDAHDTQRFIYQQLMDGLSRSWAMEGAEVCYKRGSSRLQIKTNIGSRIEEEQQLQISINRCQCLLQTLQHGHGAGRGDEWSFSSTP